MTRWSIPLIGVFVVLVGLAGCDKTTSEGTGGKKLKLSSVSNQTLTRGGTNEVKVSITRENFRDPVTISFANLPKGVDLNDKDMTIKAGDSSANFTLKAANDAELATDRPIEVTAKAAGMDPTPAQTFKLTVKEK